MSRRPLWGGAWSLALAALLSSCATPTLPGPERDELVVGVVGGPIRSIDDPAAAAISALLVEPLVRRTDTEDLEARLAEEVPTLENGGALISDDGERIVATFRIREGARWHDGTRVSAADVAFAFERDRAAPEGSSARSAAERIERIDVLDERTVRVAYRAEERWDLFALAPRALPRHLLGSEGADAAYAARPIHAGPYMIAARAAGVIELVAFPDHPIDDPEIDRVVVRTFADRTALLAAIGRGEVDVAPYPALDADLARTLDRSADGAALQVLYRQAQAVVMLRLGPRFSEPGLRRAIALAIDRDRISRQVFSGRALVPASFLVPPLWAAAEPGAVAGPDRQAAQSLLTVAGFRRGAFGDLERDADPLGGTILVPRGSPAMEAAARSIAADLAALGISLGVSQRDLAEIEDRVRRGDLELALLPEWADDPLRATERYRGVISPWADVLADAARKAPGSTEQRAIYDEYQRLWSAAAPAVPIYQILKVDLVPARLEGVRPAAHGAPITWNAAEWHVASR